MKKLIAFLIILSWNCHALIETELMIGAGYSVINDKLGNNTNKASNSGFMAQANLGARIKGVGVAGFYSYSSYETVDVQAGNLLQIFHASPIGFGGEVSFQYEKFIGTIGYGVYEAEARRVIDYIGYDYNLKDASGIHFRFSKRVSGKKVGASFFIQARFIQYGEITMLNNENELIVLDPKWNTQDYVVGVSFVI